MIRTFTLIAFLLLSGLQTLAQYADMGTGVLKDHIWWFDWSGFTVTDGASKIFTTADGLIVTVAFSNVSGEQVYPKVMNTWPGAVLHFLYDFSDPNIMPALLTPLTTQNSQFTLTVTATRNGAPASFTLVGADAEASLSPVENTTFITNGSNWRILEFFRNSSQTSNPVTGCGTQTVVITDTHNPGSLSPPVPVGQNPMMATDAPSGGTLQVDVRLEKTAWGGMAVAFGIFAPIDRGDLPASYGYAHHQLSFTGNNSCNFNPPFPGITQSGSLKLGAVMGDADAADGVDDNQNGVDEEAVQAFPDYTGNGTYSINVPLSNTTGGNAWLTGYFDYNRNGVFDLGEAVSVSVPSNATTANLTWTGLPALFTHGSVRDFGFRLRLSSSAAATQSAAGYAPDGEVEDYLQNLTVPCNNITVNTASTTVCAGQTVQLTASGGATYSWSPATGLSAANIADPVATPADNTTYTVTGRADDGCTGSALATLRVNPLPGITKSNDAAICAGNQVQLSASTPSSAVYSWSPAAGLNDPSVAMPMAGPQNTTRYTVTVTDANGCRNQADVLVTVLAAPAFSVTPLSAAVCKGESVSLRADGGETYQWTGPGNAVLGTQPGLQITPGQTTNYAVTMTACGQTTTLQVPVTVNEQPVTGITKSNDLDCSHGTAMLQATGGVQYVWDAVAGISNPNISNPVVSPLETTTYQVTITNAAGCSKKEAITVAADFSTAISTYPLPTAFTPNHDGRNDCFGLKYWGAVSSLEFNIYDRWGVLIFTAHTISDCWDGTYKGELQPAGSYVYFIKAKSPCGNVERKGAVVLVR